MTGNHRTVLRDKLWARPEGWRVIDGAGPSAAAPRVDVRVPPALTLDAEELAADMAMIFAVSLMRGHALSDLGDPHLALDQTEGAAVSLNEVMCELRNLSWWDQTSDASDGDRSWLGDAGTRRAMCLNASGQLTLRTLFQAGVAQRGESTRLSTLWHNDCAVQTPDPRPGRPAEDAPISAWLIWCGQNSGARLRFPGMPAQTLPVGTLEQMHTALHAMPPARPFHNAALAALATGTATDVGLAAAGSLWGGGRLLSLMAEAEMRVRRVVLMRAGRQDRLSRPAVTAARMTVHLAREERSDDTTAAIYRAAAEELSQAAPHLLAWVSRSNRALRGPGRFDTNLFLPLTRSDAQVHMPGDLACHVAVAGALATLLKAVFDTTRRAQVQMAGSDGTARALGEEADRMAANISLARLVGGGFHSAENDQDLRLGQAIALQLLRERMASDNRSATLGFTGFDGRAVQIQAHPRHFGRGSAELRVEGQASAWPQESSPAAAHLTAVV